MQKRTKIVATLGPATDDLETLTEMCRAGLDVARVNFSAEGSVDGGRRIEALRGNQGTQLYQLPADLDLGALPHVVIWCDRFSTPFGTATLSA